MSIITKEQWDSFKSQFPNDKKIQSVTFEELLKNTDGGKVDWQHLPKAKERDVELLTIGPFTECDLWIGYCIIDAICLGFGAAELRASLNRDVAGAVAKAAQNVIEQIEDILSKIGKESSKTDIAWSVYEIVRTIWSGGCLGAVVSAIMSSLTWYYMLLYAASGLAILVAVCATDGVAFVAEVVVELATFGFLVADAINAHKACNG